eukprot:COSAG01_NODE_408_length_17382_cov_6.231431_20_plen_56_part_01
MAVLTRLSGHACRLTDPETRENYQKYGHPVSFPIDSHRNRYEAGKGRGYREPLLLG